MTTLIKLTIALLLSLFLSSCGFDIKINGESWGSGTKGNGSVTTESRSVSEDFTEITAQEGLMVYVTQADEFKIEVEADENILELIGTDISNGRLKVHARKNIGRATKNVYVSLPDVSALKSSSGAHLKTKNTIVGDRIEIDASSGANLFIDLDADDVEVDASSGANLEIVGTTDQADFDISSGSNVNAKDFESNTCEAEASSGANLKIYVTEALVANASSGGNISYYGNASFEGQKNISGSIVHRD
ncbi:head GIN domain-containing protein [Maribacter sp. 2-571]|uniref:head GIN domain-containing protein n=1 Tax=Maribacter sp. 2-571 TaxID=3417569 RepID=UPI003D3529C5